jgi:hypothetical protein
MKTNVTTQFVLLAVLMLLQLTTFAGGYFGNYFVKGTATGTGDGSSWTDAMPNLQQAIDLAAEGDTICVAAGTYLPTHMLGTDLVRNLTFYINKAVVIYGGFSGEPGTEGSTTDRDPKVHITILSGDTGVPGDKTDNAFHVVYFDHVSDTTHLDGFTIAEGNSFNGGGFDGTGCGIFNDAQNTRSHPVIANCIIRDCLASESGGGMLNYAGNGGKGNPLLINCTFIGNEGSGGGGISNYTDSEGEANPVLIGCTFKANTARTADGGAMNCIAHSALAAPKFVHCILTGNHSPNSAAFQSFVTGTGSAKSEFINCAFSGNTGGAIKASDLAQGNSLVTIRNSIIYGNDGGTGIVVGGATVDASFSVIPFGFPGEGNIGLDPLFISQPPLDSAHTLGDLHLQQGSPAIDAGRNEDMPDSLITDLDGNPRFVNATNGQAGTVDIGPYEFQPTITRTADFLSDTEWQVSPNPANEKIDIRLPESIHYGEVRLMDMQVRVLSLKVLENGQVNSTLDVSSLSPGTYLVYVLVDGLQDVKKVVVQ